MRNQILHIFKKDCRYLWREIALSFAVMIAYGWQEATRRPGAHPLEVGFFLLSQMLPTLVPLSWAFLLLRVVQAESLVGDRQFWVTRPYDWKKLLAAKLLFVLVFFHLPLFILQSFLLLMAGYVPMSYIPGLLGLQLMWVLFLVLPVTTLAAVTASLGQFVLAVLGVLLFVISVIPALFSLVPAAGVSGGNSIPSTLCATVLLAISIVVLLWQYARRRTLHSRVTLLGAVATALVITLVAPYRMLIERAYPQATAGQPMPVQLAFDPAKLTSREGGYPEKDKVHVRIPLLVSGVSTGSAVFVAGRMVSIHAPEGAQWTSGWHAAWGTFLPNRGHGREDITIDKSFFEQVKSTPVKVRITYALAPAHARETLRVVVQAGQFALPGEGRCSFSPFDPGVVLCVFPLKAPNILVSARAEEITCPPRLNETPLPAGAIGYDWIWSYGEGVAEFGINSVLSRHLSLGDWGAVTPRDYRPRLCPGTPLTILINWEELPRLRTEVVMDGIHLADYQLDERLDGGWGVGLALP